MNSVILFFFFLIIIIIVNYLASYVESFKSKRRSGTSKGKTKIPKPPKFKLTTTKVIDKDIDTGKNCENDSLLDLKNRYNKYKKMECNYNQWKINPERCSASKKYMQKLYQFTENAIKDSKKNNVKNSELLKDRIESEENLNLYPINNYDFDYKTAMKKNYNVFKLGVTNKPTINNLIQAPNKLKPYVSVLLDKKYPNKNTVSGVSDVILDDKDALNIKKKYNQLNDTLPYPSFKKDYPECRYPTKGEHSSSYFIKAGQCKTSINNEKDCKKKKYNWVSNYPFIPDSAKELITYTNNVIPSKKNTDKKDGSCYKPRFAYIDNSAKDVYGKYGLVPSMLDDLVNFAPDKIANIMAGYTVEGSGLLPCIDD